MNLSILRLKKGEERRIRQGSPWIYSNEIDNVKTPIKQFSAGEEVIVQAADKSLLGIAYINPHSLISARLFSNQPNQRLTIDFFVTKLKQALLLREGLFSKPFYRLVFGEADGIPGLIIDRFDQDLVLQFNTAGIDKCKNMVADSLLTVIPSIKSMLMRNDTSARERENLNLEVAPLYGQPPEISILEENNTRFYTSLIHGQKTGWFYDHRMNRARLLSYINNKRVLDVFSYLGGWGIQCATHGAKQVDCIDASEFAIDYIKKNAALNSVEINAINADAFDALKMLYKSKETYDVIILDPPAFIKRAKDSKEGMVAYQRLNEMALRLLNPNGILVSCSCSMHLSQQGLMQLIRKAALKTKTALQVIEYGHQGMDHPIHLHLAETNYLKAIFLRKIE